jgi:hypothetical protein
MNSMVGPSVLTKRQVRLAYAVGVTADVMQLALGPLGWAGTDETIDIAAMIMISRLIGFHYLLLPAFVLEFLPMADLLPTWTACVALVVLLRRRQEAAAHPPPGPGPVIDV